MRITLNRLLSFGGQIAALVFATSVAHAQQGSATLRGRVTDAGSHQAIARAEIILAVDSRSVRTNKHGDYVFTGLPVGTVELLVRAPSYPIRRMVVELTDGEVLDGSVTLDSSRLGAAQSLAPVKVSAAAPVNDRLRDFERRRRSGRGQYLTDAQIRASGADNLQDAVRDMRGVLLDCGGTMYGGCRIRMARAPERCLPEYVVDGQVDNEFGPTTPIRDIVGVELYTGESDVPGEYAGSDAGCGVIVIWTRSGPDRRRAKHGTGDPSQ